MSAGPSGGGFNIDYTREDVDYDSTNEEDEDTRQAKKARRDLAEKPRTDKKSKAKVKSICWSTFNLCLVFQGRDICFQH